MYRPDIILAVQQILFLPHFETLEYKSHGNAGNEGNLPTVREAWIMGPNGHLVIMTNFYFSNTYTYIYGAAADGSFSVVDGECSSEEARWLMYEIFHPIRDSLMSLPT
jgi:hypothetical protein